MEVFRLNCAHCHGIFLCNTKALVKCPQCKRVSSVGPEFAKNRATIYFSLAFLCLVIGVVVTWGTYEAATPGGMYIVYIGAFANALVFLFRGIYFSIMEVSVIEAVNHSTCGSFN